MGKVLKKSLFNWVKNSKVFYLKDLFAYAVAALLIGVLAVFFLILPSTNNTRGFKVELGGNSVFTYSFSTNNYEVFDEFINLVTVEELDGGISFTIKTSDGFNKIYISKTEKTAAVIDSDCSVSKDCVHSPKIKDSGAIVCAPHKLKLFPLSDSGMGEPITG